MHRAAWIVQLRHREAAAESCVHQHLHPGVSKLMPVAYKLGHARPVDWQDLNSSPAFAAEDETFDAVICCVSVQYLQYPEKVFAECVS